MKRLLIPVFLFGVATLFFLSCQKEMSQESNINTATFSLLDDSSNCLSAPVANGDYYNGVAARDVNFVTVVVNVKTTGNYSVASDNQNGFYFSDSGFFSRVGLDTLILKMRGAPILVQPTTFSLSDTTCSFLVDVMDSTGTGLGGVDTSGSGVTNGGSASYVDPDPAGDDSWHFKDSTNDKSYSGSMLGANLQSAFGLNVLSGNGTQGSNAKEIFQFLINLPTTDIATGSYQADFITSFITLSNTASSTPTVEYSTDGSSAEEAVDPSYINITSYDASTKRLKISFRCWATDASGNPALIKGSLNTKVQ